MAVEKLVKMVKMVAMCIGSIDMHTFGERVCAGAMQRYFVDDTILWPDIPGGGKQN